MTAPGSPDRARHARSKGARRVMEVPGPARVAVLAPLFPPAFRGGGPIRSIQALIATAGDDMAPFVLTGDRDLGAAEALPVPANTWSIRDGAAVYYATVRSPRLYWRALRALRRRRPDLLHLNSFLNPMLTIVPLLLWRIGFWGDAVVLLAPRGEFGEGALARRTWRKRCYMVLFRTLRLHRSVVWHSTAPHETAAIRRRWGPDARIVERGNDTLLPVTASAPTAATDGPIRAVFLGRIVDHKGLAIVLEALAGVTRPVDLDVYGSREDEDYATRCEALAAALPSHLAVRFHGTVAPDEAVTVLGHHDVLLMPTAGENFGHVIAEALSASCGVATTPFTPWTDELLAGGGVVVEDRSPRAWAAAIEELAAEAPPARLARRVDAGRTYDAWAARPRPPHVWTLALRAAGRRGG